MVQFITRQLDAFFKYFESFGSHKGSVWSTQLFLLMINLILSIYPIICYFTLSSTVHVLFWMGDAPRFVNLAVPLVLLVFNVIVMHFRCVSTPMKNVQAVLFTTLLAIGAILLGLGAYTLVLSTAASEDLTQACGSTSQTAQLQAETKRLADFLEECQNQHGAVQSVQMCPGFAQTFPNTVYVEYIAKMENDFGCAGFCDYWAEPLFNKEGAEKGLRCATALGEEMESVGTFVGIPTMSYGVLIMGVGLCIAGYDHL